MANRRNKSKNPTGEARTRAAAKMYYDGLSSYDLGEMFGVSEGTIRLSWMKSPYWEDEINKLRDIRVRLLEAESRADYLNKLDRNYRNYEPIAEGWKQVSVITLSKIRQIYDLMGSNEPTLEQVKKIKELTHAGVQQCQHSFGLFNGLTDVDKVKDHIDKLEKQEGS